MKQYLYEITSQNKNCDYGCSNDESIFLISRNKYSFFEFENICERAKEMAWKTNEGVSPYFLSKSLVENFPFDFVNIETGYNIE